MDWSRDLRSGKVTATGLALPTKLVKHAVMLPSRYAFDIQAGIACGVFNHKTRFTLAERDQETADMLNYITMPRLNVGAYRVHNQPIETLPITRKVDYAYLGFCGWLNPQKYEWIKSVLLPQMVKGSRFAVTLSRAVRNCNDYQFLNYPMQIYQLGLLFPDLKVWEYRDTKTPMAMAYAVV